MPCPGAIAKTGGLISRSFIAIADGFIVQPPCKYSPKMAFQADHDSKNPARIPKFWPSAWYIGRMQTPRKRPKSPLSVRFSSVYAISKRMAVAADSVDT
jgi:hypothetical protein